MSNPPTQRLMTMHLARANKRTEDALAVLANTKHELLGTISRIRPERFRVGMHRFFPADSVPQTVPEYRSTRYRVNCR